jgi:hypothetical protein
MHGEISREEAAEFLEKSLLLLLLRNHPLICTDGKVGNYLVRPSQNNYSLSF